MNMTLGAVGYNDMMKYVAVSGYYITMKGKTGFSDQYFRIWLSSPEAIRLYKLYATGSLIEKQRVQFSTLSIIKACIPGEEEQISIGTFFHHLDHTIALLQRKVDKLQKLKQGFLQQMFPQDGESVPRLRFANFKGEWQQRMLKNLAIFSKGSGHTKNDLTPSGTPIILYGRLYTNYETVIEKVNTFVMENGSSIFSMGNEVIVPASGETAEAISRASVVAMAGILIGGDLNIIRPNEDINSVFLALTISNGNQQKELSKRAQGKSVVHLHNSDLKDIDLFYPPKEEQIKIGSLIRRFEIAIARYQTRLNKLQNLKSVYLQRMFI